MLRTRVIPVLLLKDGVLVKTVRFKNPQYVGDPVNTVRIFNELEVDELVILDISASKEKREPDYEQIRKIADECFMPLAYGGGITNTEQVKNILEIGLEKVVINSHAINAPQIITDAAGLYGNQCIIASIDVRKNLFGNDSVYGTSGTINAKRKPLDWAQQVQKLGAGEILLTSINKEGTWSGLDLELIKSVTDATRIPVIAHGGAGSIDDIEAVVKRGGASAVALGSMVVYQKKGMGVLVKFPDKPKLKAILE